MLHWWYAPDSYDTWVTDIHIDLDVDDIFNPDGAWEVRKTVLFLNGSKYSVTKNLLCYVLWSSHLTRSLVTSGCDNIVVLITKSYLK